ncbi:MAG TPA: hypothetical protein VFK32_00230, partial [Tepidiformaceae bacterium]|nr:hypothetical protein [Tepidiformaceae bacterium]
MLRLRPDAMLEFRAIELTIRSAAPAALMPERREALRARILAQLGAQDQPESAFGRLVHERWITIPVGAGIAATVIAAARPLLESVAPTTDEDVAHALAFGEITVNGHAQDRLAVGETATAATNSDLVLDRTRASLAEGTAVTLIEDDAGGVTFGMSSGSITAASDGRRLEIRAPSWQALLFDGGVISVASLANGDWTLDLLEG